MRILNRISLTLLTVFAICFITSCTKPNSNLTNKNESQEKTQLSNDPLTTIYPTRAIKKHDDITGDDDTLSLSINNYDFTIYPSGLLKWGDKDSVILSNDMYVTIAYFQLIGNDLLLFCEMSDSDNGTSEIFRINLANKHIKWKTNLSGFNLGRPVIRSNFGYITAIGCIGKLDILTGKYIYVNSNLYDIKTGAFNDFDTVLFQGNNTYFVAKRPTTNNIDSVIFDEKSNTIRIKKTWP